MHKKQACIFASKLTQAAKLCRKRRKVVNQDEVTTHQIDVVLMLTLINVVLDILKVKAIIDTALDLVLIAGLEVVLKDSFQDFLQNKLFKIFLDVVPDIIDVFLDIILNIVLHGRVVVQL